MRVLHIGKYYPPFAGGMEHFLSDLLSASAARGLSVAALVHNERAGHRGIRPGGEDPLPIYRAPCLGRVLYAPLSPSFPLWLDLAIREFIPDLLHFHLPNTSAFAALTATRARHLPWVLHWHADVVSSRIDRILGLAYNLYRPFEGHLLARSAAVIATSPPYLEESAALRPWRDRCTAIPLGLDTSRLPLPTPEQIDAGACRWGRTAIRILAIGRLTYYKGHEVLMRAVADLQNAKLLIVGTGDRGPSLLRLRQKLALEGQVTFLGSQSRHELAVLLASCDLLCLPSLERTEAFGLVLLEAMRYAKPVVASDIPGSGTGWLVRQAGHGLLIPPGDIDALADALRRLAMDAELRRRFGRKGKAALEARFGIHHVAEAISRVYAHVLAKHSP